MTNLVFDVGGTLVFNDTQSFIKTVISCIDSKRTALHEIATEYFFTKPITVPGSIYEFCREVSLDPMLFTKALNYKPQPPILFGDVKQALTDLKEFKKVTLSNVSSVDCFSMSELGLGNFFDESFSSFQLGYAKPNSACFKFVEQKLRSQCDQFVMVGDSMRCDINPAKRLGWTTILLDRTLKLASESKPDYRIGSLAELPAILRHTTINAARK